VPTFVVTELARVVKIQHYVLLTVLAVVIEFAILFEEKVSLLVLKIVVSAVTMFVTSTSKILVSVPRTAVIVEMKFVMLTVARIKYLVQLIVDKVFVVTRNAQLENLLRLAPAIVFPHLLIQMLLRSH